MQVPEYEWFFIIIAGRDFDAREGDLGPMPTPAPGLSRLAESWFCPVDDATANCAHCGSVASCGVLRGAARFAVRQKYRVLFEYGG